MQPRLKLSRYPYSFMVPALLIVGIFAFLPTLSSFVMAFTDWDITRFEKPAFNGLTNFKEIFEDEYFFLSVSNTILFAAVTAVAKIGFGLLLAIALTGNLATRDLMRTVFYLPCVLSMVVIGLIFTSVLRYEGMLNHLLVSVGLFREPVDWLGDPGLAIWCTIVAEVWRWTGFTMAIFIAGLQTIPRELYESANIDGAGGWNKFRHVTLPLIAPAMTIAATIHVMGGLKVFEQVYVMTNGGPGFASQVLSTYVFRTFSEGLLGKSTAMGLLLFVFVALVSVAYNRQLKSREVSL
jgi:raffinose/stachyose/melibiose transport system permease protein